MYQVTARILSPAHVYDAPGTDAARNVNNESQSRTKTFHTSRVQVIMAGQIHGSWEDGCQLFRTSAMLNSGFKRRLGHHKTHENVRRQEDGMRDMDSVSCPCFSSSLLLCIGIGPGAEHIEYRSFAGMASLSRCGKSRRDLIHTLS